MKKSNTKTRLQSVSHLFYTKNESWWLIGFSMLLASGIMIEPQLICASLLHGQLSDMWLYWSAAIGSAFSVSFFAHLWRNVPAKTENEFLFFRFSGIGARLLHAFRSLYLGVLVIPFIISFSLLAYSKIACYILGIELRSAVVFLTILLVLLSFFNSLKTRLRTDFVLFVLFIIVFAIVIGSLYNTTGGLSHLSQTVRTFKINFSIFPAFGSKTFSAFVVFVAVQWWSAALLDYPDMNGQKLMATNSTKDLVKSVFIPSLALLLFRVIMFTLPFMAVCYGFTNGITDTELAFTAIFVKTLPSWMLYFVLLLFMIPFLSVVQNNQNWGGALLIENFYKHHINPNLSAEKSKTLGTFAMIYMVLVAGGIALYADSLIGITKYIFAITAGIGPVFILRWYWWRINAWSQLSAMVAALVLPPIFDGLFAYCKTFHLFIMQVENSCTMDYYPIKLVVLTLVVCSVWLLVTFLTAPTERAVLQNFVSTIKPGGFWNGFENKGKSFSKIRGIAWLLQTANGFLVYFMFWNFLVGNYAVFVVLLLVFGICFLLACMLIAKANRLYDNSLKASSFDC